MKRYLTLGIAVLTLAACGGRGSVANGPDWLDGTSKKYPAQQYIVGTAQSQGLDDAKNRARAEVAKVFEVAIREQSRDNLQYISNGAGSELAQRVERDTTTRTEKVLRGVEIADTWLQPDTHQYYALAVLHRGNSARALRQEVEQLDQATRSHIDRARNSGDTLDKLASAYAALSTQMERAGVQRSLQVVDNSGQGVAPRWNLADLGNDFRAQLARVKVSPQVTAAPEGFAAQVSGALGAAGFLVKEGQSPDFTMATTLELAAPDLREGWYWVNGRLEIQLSDTQGRVRGSQRWSIKASATSADVANKRALDQATRLLQEELRTTLLGFAKE